MIAQPARTYEAGVYQGQDLFDEPLPPPSFQ